MCLKNKQLEHYPCPQSNGKMPKALSGLQRALCLGRDPCLALFLVLPHLFDNPSPQTVLCHLFDPLAGLPPKTLGDHIEVPWLREIVMKGVIAVLEDFGRLQGFGGEGVAFVGMLRIAFPAFGER
jgi:hypothetical protein